MRVSRGELEVWFAPCAGKRWDLRRRVPHVVPCTLRQDDSFRWLTQLRSPGVDAPYRYPRAEHALQKVARPDVCQVQGGAPGEAAPSTPALWLRKMGFVYGCTHACVSCVSVFTQPAVPGHPCSHVAAFGPHMSRLPCGNESPPSDVVRWSPVMRENIYTWCVENYIPGAWRHDLTFRGNSVFNFRLRSPP